MLKLLTTVLVALPLAMAQAQEHGHREHGAHDHGSGTLSLALEGNKLSMELNVPADDIIGFEHVAKTKKQKAALAKAKRTLAEPLGLFALPSEAGCTVEKADINYTHDKDAAKHGHDHGAQKAKQGEAEHAEFDVDYTLDCKAPARLTSIKFAYFAVFPKTAKLQVNIASAKGQTSLEATKANSTLSLAGKL